MDFDYYDDAPETEIITLYYIPTFKTYISNPKLLFMARSASIVLPPFAFWNKQLFSAYLPKKSVYLVNIQKIPF